MNYNIVVIVSIVICAIIALVLSYYGTLLILDETSGLFKATQLIIAIITITTVYAPIKYILLKYMNVDLDESENKND